MWTKIVFKKTLQEKLFWAWTWRVIFLPLTPRKTFSKSAHKFDLLGVYLRARRNGLENVHKIQILRVYTDTKSRNTKCVRAHARNLVFLEVYIATFLGTRLNAKKVEFDVFTRVSGSSWLPGQAIDKCEEKHEKCKREEYKHSLISQVLNAILASVLTVIFIE